MPASLRRSRGLVYIDLNPIRAGIAATPEESRFTSAYERIAARHGDETASGTLLAAEAAGESSEGPTERLPDSNAGPPCSDVNDVAGAAVSGSIRRAPSRPDDRLSSLELSESAAQSPVPAGRASNTGCLPMRLDQYLELLDWTGRQVRQDKRGAIPGGLAPILERLQLPGESWLELVTNFGRLFRRSAGMPESLRRDAEKRGRRRAVGVRASRQLFG